MRVSDDDEAWALRELIEFALKNYEQVKKELSAEQ